MQTSVSITDSSNWFTIKPILLLILLIIFGIISTILISDFDLFNHNMKSQNSENQHSGNGRNSNKLNIKIQSNKEIYQLGKHFNKHGRAMGYASKSEYNSAALKFAETYSKNPLAKIVEGTWNGTGDMTRNARQIAITFENRTVIIDKMTGQLIDFYEGEELRGLIKLITLQ